MSLSSVPRGPGLNISKQDALFGAGDQLAGLFEVVRLARRREPQGGALGAGQLGRRFVVGLELFRRGVAGGLTKAFHCAM